MRRAIGNPEVCWHLGRVALRAGRLPLLMGVVNVTPDSFSDGGRYFEPAAACEHALRLIDAGADLLDIGGESTRPGAPPVAAEEQLRRVMPVIERLRRQTARPLSIDTRSATVAAAALAAGADIVNDVTALTGEQEMLSLVARSPCGVCLMHMQGTPRTMQVEPHYDDVVREVVEYLRQRRDALEAVGVARQRIAVDPGIGFGKTAAHNLALLQQIEALAELGCCVLVGVSRKRFIGEVQGDLEADRVAGTIGAALALARRGAQVLRVHDVAAVRHALQLFDAAGGLTD